MSPPDPQPDAGGTATPIKRGRPSRSFAAAATTASASNATTRAAAASRSPPDTQNDHADEAASATNTAFGDVYEADSGEDSSADERRARKKKRKPTDLTVVSALRFPVRSAAASQPVVHSPSLLLSTLSAAAGAAVQNNGAAVAAPPAAAATASNCNSKATGGGGGSRASKLNAALKIDEHRDTSTSPPPLEGAGSYGATSGVAGAVPSLSSTPLGRFANNPIKQAATRPRAPPLDFSTVRTQGPRVPPPRTKSRTFGLEDAPTFYPTQKEFKDPMEYIRWCGDEGGAREFGICKIVPPEGWQPPFVMNTETFFFKTRLMQLNNMEAKSRAKLNFLDQLYIFHRQQGNPNISIPTVDHKEVDLWLLRREIGKLGGFDAVTNNRKWSEVARILGYAEAFAHQLKGVYARLIVPFDEYSTHARSISQSPAVNRHSSSSQQPPAPLGNTNASPLAFSGGAGMRMNPRASSSSTTKPVVSSSLNLGPIGRNGHSHHGRAVTPPAPGGGGKDEPVPRTLNFDADEGDSSGLSDPEEEQPKKPERKKPGPKKGWRKRKKGVAPDPSAPIEPGELCEICRRGDDEPKFLLCDGCDQGFHIYCLEPPLQEVPNNESWYCSACLFETGLEFGFDEGEEHSLHSFQQRDTAFREHWFSTHPPKSKRSSTSNSSGELEPPNGVTQKIGGVDVSEHDVETEFWRLVESQTETVEVEYGADVHSSDHGSGAPTFERYPTNPYSLDPWNLNNLPILPGSVLRYIKSNISGMTIPWIYVGFALSAFCWHNEDHYTSSINYMHWGETKTWYGIPGDDADKFEAAMKQEAPDLFEQQPSLLFQLITLMNPGRVRKAGVRVFACDQRSNEFVITYPKAYHAGFNHGLNYNEAVNFAPADWLPFGSECVVNYQRHMKPPVFDHSELLLSIVEHATSSDIALALSDNLRQAVDRELENREQFRIVSDSTGERGEILSEIDRPEDEYQCLVCKTFCYLSQIVCACTTSVACLDHGNQLCECPPSTRVLRLRIADDDLATLPELVELRAAAPKAWKKRLVALLESTPKPPLHALQELVAVGERVKYPKPDFGGFKAFVDRCNELVAHAAAFRVGGASEAVSSPKDVVAKDENTIAKTMPRTVAAATKILADSDKLSFDAPEFRDLQAQVSRVADIQTRLTAMVALPDKEKEQNQARIEALISEGKTFGFDFPEVRELEKSLGRIRWTEHFNRVGYSERLDLAQVKTLLWQAEESSIEPTNPFLVHLGRLNVVGQAWVDDALRVLGNPVVSFEALDDLIRRSRDVPGDASIVERLQLLQSISVDSAQQARAIFEGVAAGHAPNLAQIRRIVEQAAKAESQVDVPELEALRVEIQLHDSFIASVQSFLPGVKRVSQLEVELHQMLLNVQERTVPADDLPQPFPMPRLPPAIPGLPTPEMPALVQYVNSEHGLVPPRPLHTFSCICRKNEFLPMLQCRTCRATYHGACVGVSPRGMNKTKRYFCLTCDPKKIDDARPMRPKLSALTKAIHASDASFRFPPPEYQLLLSIAQLAIRFLEVVSPHLQPAAPTGPIDEAELDLLRHFTRKLELMAIDLEVLSATGSVVDVREALIAATDTVGRRQRPVRLTPKYYVPPPTAAIASRPPPSAIAPALNGASVAATATTTARPTPPAALQAITASATPPVLAATAASHTLVPPAPQPPQALPARVRPPSWTLEKEAGHHGPGAVDCLCLGSRCPRDGRLSTVTCKNVKCQQRFHASCVYAPPPLIDDENGRPLFDGFAYRCPLCCVKAGASYPHAILRLQMQEDIGTQRYVDVKGTLAQNDELLYNTLPPLMAPHIILIATSFRAGSAKNPPIQIVRPPQPAQPVKRGPGRPPKRPRLVAPQLAQPVAVPVVPERSVSPSPPPEPRPEVPYETQMTAIVDATLERMKDRIRALEPELSEAAIEYKARQSLGSVTEFDSLSPQPTPQSASNGVARPISAASTAPVLSSTSSSAKASPAPPRTGNGVSTGSASPAHPPPSHAAPAASSSSATTIQV